MKAGRQNGRLWTVGDRLTERPAPTSSPRSHADHLHAPHLPTRKAALLRRTVGLLALVVVLALPQAASAQSRDGRGGDRVEQRVDDLRQTLALTDAQTAEVRALFEAQAANRPARGARRSGSPDDRAAMQAERQGRQAEQDRQIESLLTPAQIERYRAWRAAQPQGRASRRGGTR